MIENFRFCSNDVFLVFIRFGGKLSGKHGLSVGETSSPFLEPNFICKATNTWNFFSLNKKDKVFSLINGTNKFHNNSMKIEKIPKS